MHVHEELSNKLTTRIAYDGNGNTEYLGIASAGVATSAAKWRIKKIIYDGNQNPVSVLFASGDSEFDKVWDDREIYIFS